MLDPQYLQDVQTDLERLKREGMYKDEWTIHSSQSSEVEIDRGKVLNFCANNYLGLANDPRVIEAAKKGLDEYGFGTASVRFICGTMDVHQELEQRIAQFLGYEDAITYASCWHANGGLYQALLGPEDAILSADLNHASLIDGIRLCKAKRYFYQHDNMEDLEAKLRESQGERVRMIATDGVFSMDGDIAPLDKICDLAEKYNAMVMIDDCHATGFIGKTGRGTIEYHDVVGRVDIVSSTLGKALGGSVGGFVAAKKEIVERLRNYSRPYLFSNNVLPSVAAASLEVLNILENSSDLLDRLQENTQYFRSQMVEAGFNVRPGVHPVAPIMLGDAKLASDMARDMIEQENVYVIGFSYPVVPKGEARIRVQLSAAHTREQLDQAIQGFIRVGKKHGVI